MFKQHRPHIEWKIPITATITARDPKIIKPLHQDTGICKVKWIGLCKKNEEMQIHQIGATYMGSADFGGV